MYCHSKSHQLLKAVSDIQLISCFQQEIAFSTASSTFVVKQSSCYELPQQADKPTKSLCFFDMNTIVTGHDQQLQITDLRSNQQQIYTNFASESIYRLAKTPNNQLICACDLSENTLNVVDLRNPLQPLNQLSLHSEFVTKIFCLHDYFYSADEGGNIYKLEYDGKTVLNRIKFNRSQQMIDIDYNFQKDYFLILLENNIIKQTEFEVFDDIENDPDKTPYHGLLFCQNYSRTVFYNNAEVIFCDELCDDYGEYIKTTDADCITSAFQQGVLFTDGPTLLYNVLDIK